MIELPPLPPTLGIAAYRLDAPTGAGAYSAEQMRSYGEACARAALEAAAQVCDERAHYYRGDDDGPDGREYRDYAEYLERESIKSRRTIACEACAAVVRAMKDAP